LSLACLLYYVTIPFSVRKARRMKALAAKAAAKEKNPSPLLSGNPETDEIRPPLH
jgi:hypothetical protein